MQFQKKWIAIVRRLGGVVSSSSDSHMISIRGNVTWSATTPAWRSSSFGMIRHNVLVVLFPAQNPGPPGTDIRPHREWFLRKDKKKKLLEMQNDETERLSTFPIYETVGLFGSHPH
jgi:hypothetical protein